MKRLDLTGQPFGRLRVESFAGIRKGRTTWTCVCECGNRIVVIGKLLSNGDTKSCGSCPNRIEHFDGDIAVWLKMKDRDVICWINAADYPLVKDHR